jgi:proteasome beta subunit
MERNTLYVKDSQVLSTGTTTVGIIGKDCVVLAADKRATAGNFIADKKVQKVISVNERIAITTAGTVSDIQLMAKLIRAELKLKAIRSDRDSTVREAANLLAELVYANIRKYSTIPGITHFLLGGTDASLSLYDIYPDGSVTQIDDFVSSGSGCVYAYGVLENSYRQGLSEQEAVDLAIRSVNAAMQRDTASGEGIDCFIIDKNGIRQEASKKVSKALV